MSPSNPKPGSKPDQKLDPKLKELLSEMERFGIENDQRETDRKRKMLNLEPETAALLHILVRATHRHSILEIGTSNGYSTIWLAHAMRAGTNGRARKHRAQPRKTGNGASKSPACRPAQFCSALRRGGLGRSQNVRRAFRLCVLRCRPDQRAQAARYSNAEAST